MYSYLDIYKIEYQINKTKKTLIGHLVLFLALRQNQSSACFCIDIFSNALKDFYDRLPQQSMPVVYYLTFTCFPGVYSEFSMFLLKLIISWMMHHDYRGQFIAFSVVYIHLNDI